MKFFFSQKPAAFKQHLQTLAKICKKSDMGLQCGGLVTRIFESYLFKFFEFRCSQITVSLCYLVEFDFCYLDIFCQMASKYVIKESLTYSYLTQGCSVSLGQTLILIIYDQIVSMISKTRHVLSKTTVLMHNQIGMYVLFNPI